MKAWTDYPIEQLGDEGGKRAPVRECEVLAYDGNKYAYVKIGDVYTSFKAGYLYEAPGRLGEFLCVNIDEIEKLPLPSTVYPWSEE